LLGKSATPSDTLILLVLLLLLLLLLLPLLLLLLLFTSMPCVGREAEGLR